MWRRSCCKAGQEWRLTTERDGLRSTWQPIAGIWMWSKSEQEEEEEEEVEGIEKE